MNIPVKFQFDRMKDDTGVSYGEPTTAAGWSAARTFYQSISRDLTQRLRRFHSSRHRPDWWNAYLHGGFR